MASDLVEQLKGIDQAVLTDVVRKDQHDSDLTLLDWTVEPISHEKIIDTTGGLIPIQRALPKCKGQTSLDGGNEMYQQAQRGE